MFHLFAASLRQSLQKSHVSSNLLLQSWVKQWFCLLKNFSKDLARALLLPLRQFTAFWFLLLSLLPILQGQLRMVQAMFSYGHPPLHLRSLIERGTVVTHGIFGFPYTNHIIHISHTSSPSKGRTLL